MDAIALLAELRGRGLRVTASADRLTISPRSKLDASLTDAIRAHKPALIALVTRRGDLAAFEADGLFASGDVIDAGPLPPGELPGPRRPWTPEENDLREWWQANRDRVPDAPFVVEGVRFRDRGWLVGGIDREVQAQEAGPRAIGALHDIECVRRLIGDPA